MYVLVDYHPLFNEVNITSSTAEVVSRWQGVWRAITGLPNYSSDLRGRVMVDIMNEPDSQGLMWHAQVGAGLG
jgi:hypothetical protein